MTRLIAGLVCLALMYLPVSAKAAGENRAQDFNFDWKFSLLEGSVPKPTKPSALPSQVPLDDTSWRTVRLPHDWSVEASFDEAFEGATGYLPGGIGVYQKHFQSPKNSAEKRLFILFDGVYNNATFWLNGHKLGENPYGYSPVYFDMSAHLKQDGSDNILTVHVDHSRYADSRWYTGSGIYRNVKLIAVNKLHIPIWGTFVTTPEVSKERATVSIDVQLENHSGQKQSFQVVTDIYDATGVRVAQAAKKVSLKDTKLNTITQALEVKQPKLWGIETPHLYKAVTTLVQDGHVVDEYVTPFGIRHIEFIAQRGFFLNGEPTLLKGVSLHHDGGLVGAAVPKGVWKRRLQALKAGGVNAIRTAHNPFSQEFLDLCDEMGFLVQNEFFDEFDYPKDKRLNMRERHDDYISRGYAEHFHEWGKSDLTRTMLRDRNHPSVIQWSLGNEIEWTYEHYRYITGFWDNPDNPEDMDAAFWGAPPKYSPEEMRARYEASEKGQYVLADTAKRLNSWVKALDTTRPTTANLILPQVSHVSGYADAVDIPGYSYRNSVIPWGQTHFPNKPVTINENPGTWDDWKQVLQHPGVFSQFMWTGIDYMGERHNKWPQKTGWGDMLDLAGFKVQGWNYFKSIWTTEPHLSIGTLPLGKSGFKQDSLSGLAVLDESGSYRWRNSDMHWNYQAKEPVLVEISANFTQVELLLNGRSLGFRSMSESPNRLLRWVVPFEAGTLQARAEFNGEIYTTELATSGKAVAMAVTADKTQLTADGYDVSHVVVQLYDEDGTPVRTENTNVTFNITGDARLLGVDNGAADNVQDFQSNSLVTDRGRALAILQANRTQGLVKVEVEAEGFETQSLLLTVE